MSQSTPNDDSDTNVDRLRYSSLIQPQYTYYRFLISLQAAYDSIHRPSSAIRSPGEVEDPSSSASSISDQDAVGPDKDSQSPNTPEAPGPSTSQANMFHNARNFRIGDNTALVNIANRIQCGDNSLLVIIVCAFLCILLLFPGVYHQSLTANSSASVLQTFPPEIHYTSRDTIYGLDRLEPFVSHGAINGSNVQDPTRRVHPGTRKKVLSHIKAWIDNPNAAERILWLHGPVGVGKSTIAQTIIYSYTTEKIPANFFFLHSDSDRNDGNRLFTTLAWQLTSSIPAINRHIARSLIEQPDLPRKDVETQFQELIVRPFEALNNGTHSPQPDMVVVIDGVDECVDIRLQGRFLNVIVNKTIDHIKHHKLVIDLADYADTDRDIKEYLKNKLNDIAKEQHIDPAIWPSQKAIQELVLKASGQFIYASTVIEFVGNEYNNATSQLNTILGLMEAPTTTRPFAQLDKLYIKILEQQPDQELLKAFLPWLVARSRIKFKEYNFTLEIQPFIPGPPRHVTYVAHYSCAFITHQCLDYPNLVQGYGILMNTTEQELRWKLRTMNSLLEFIPPDIIDIRHQSFLEFLYDPSRSSQYNISAEGALKQQLVQVISSLIQAAEQAFDQPKYHPPILSDTIAFISPHMKGNAVADVLSGDDLQEVTRPLLKYQDRLLDLPNIIQRNDCTVFHVVNNLISTLLHRDDWRGREQNAVIGLEPVRNLLKVFSSLAHFFRRLKGMFNLVITLLFVKPEVATMKIHSWSEAQNMMNLISLISNVSGRYLPRSLWSKDIARKAIQLAFEIHTRVPVLPQSISGAEYVSSPYSVVLYRREPEPEAFVQTLIICNFLDHQYVLVCHHQSIELMLMADSYAGIPFKFGGLIYLCVFAGDHTYHINAWRKHAQADFPSYTLMMMFVMLKLARTIQYLHSMGFALPDGIRPDDIYLDAELRVRVSPMDLVWLRYGHSSQEVDQRYEDDIYTFGYILCIIEFGAESSCTTSWATRTILTPLHKPEISISEDVGQLIRRCLSAEDKPTIVEVVQEMKILLHRVKTQY